MTEFTDFVWVFNGSKGRFPGGIFSDLAVARQWVAKHKLTGVLTAYPLNQGSFDWAVANDLHNLSSDKLAIKSVDPDFIGSFSSASQEHIHFEQGTEPA